MSGRGCIDLRVEVSGGRDDSGVEFEVSREWT